MSPGCRYLNDQDNRGLRGSIPREWSNLERHELTRL